MDIIGRKVRRELQVELPDGGIGKELLVGTVTAYSRESTYYEVDYNDGGELEEFTRHELVPMLVPQPPPRPSGSGASDTTRATAGGGTRGGSSGSERKNDLATSSSRGQSPGGYMTEMELRAGVTPEVAAMERLIGRKVKHQVTRRVEGPDGGGTDETFEALGFVSLYSPENNLFTVEFEDGGEDTFSPSALDIALMPEEMVRIEAELREEREAVHRERDKVRAAEDAISDEANAAEASQLAHLAERRDAVRAQEVKEEVQRLEIEQGEQSEAFEEEKAKRDAELVEELKRDMRTKEAAAKEATKRTKDEMAVIRHLIEQANKTALDIKKDKMLVKREMDELAKQQAKLASRLTDDERAIMDMAQRVDEKLRARVRDIRTRAEADIAEVQQQVAEEEALIRRMQENLDDDEERQTVEAARRLRDMQIHSHVTLHEEIKKQLFEKASMERDAVGVKAGMESFREQVKQHDAFLVKYEMGTRNLRLELEEERTKANQHTVEKIGFLARDMQRAKDAMHLNNEKLKTVQAAVEPLIEKVSASAEEASTGLLACKKDFDDTMAEVAESVKTMRKRVKQDVKIMNEGVEQDLLELRAAMTRRNRAAQSTSCSIA